MSYKDLYINGCSFTKGHNLEPKDTWPVKLSNSLNLRLINHSKNAQGLESIVYNSIAHLSELDPKETLVVIGFTWLDRFLVQAFGFNFTLTSGDIEREKTEWGHRFGERASSPFSVYDHYVKKKEGNFPHLRDKLNIILTKYREYLKYLITNDEKYIEHSQLKGLTLKIMLQSFLKANYFNYRFIEFAGDTGLCSKILHSNPKMIDKLDKNNITEISLKEFCDDIVDSHPSAKCCTHITETVKTDLKL